MRTRRRRAAVLVRQAADAVAAPLFARVGEWRKRGSGSWCCGPRIACICCAGAAPRHPRCGRRRGGMVSPEVPGTRPRGPAGAGRPGGKRGPAGRFRISSRNRIIMISRSAATAALFGLVLSGCSASGMFKQGAGDAPASDAAGRYAQALAQEQSPDDIENDKNLARDGAQPRWTCCGACAARWPRATKPARRRNCPPCWPSSPAICAPASCRRS